jgi:predicted AlkP superfamily pyrophosphatase or phosphodiesterase
MLECIHARSRVAALALAILVVATEARAQGGPFGLEPHGVVGAGPAPIVQPLAGPAARLVLVVSIDGLRPDALQLAATPNLDALAEAGARTFEARSSEIPKTLPSHTSMVTGVQPSRHGFTFNRWRPWEGTLDQPTMFRWVRAAGAATTMVVAKRKFKLLAVPGDVQAFRVPKARPWSLKGTADRVVAKVLDYLEEGRRGLFFVHLAEVDDRGHRHGWMSPSQLEAVEFVDQQIGRLRAWVEASDVAATTSWVVTADHGGHGKDHGELGEHDEDYLPEDTTVPFLLSGAGVRQGGDLHGASVVDVAPTACALLGVAVPRGLDGVALAGALDRPPPAPTGEIGDAAPLRPDVGRRVRATLSRWNPF